MPNTPYSVSCCTSIIVPPIGPAEFRQARNYQTSALADIWLPASSLPGGGSNYYLYNPNDGLCYYIDFSDSVSQTPGTILAGWQNLSAGQVAVYCDGASENICVTGGFTFTLGFVNEVSPPTAANTFRYSSDFTVVLAADDDYIELANITLDDYLWLLKSTDTLALAYNSGTTTATITVPGTAALVADNTGAYGPGGLYHKTITDGTHSITNLTSETKNAPDMAIAGFRVAGINYGLMSGSTIRITKAELVAAGLMTGNTATLKFAFHPGDYSNATNINVFCGVATTHAICQGGGGMNYDTGDRYEYHPIPNSNTMRVTDSFLVEPQDTEVFIQFDYFYLDDLAVVIRSTDTVGVAWNAGANRLDITLPTEHLLLRPNVGNFNSVTDWVNKRFIAGASTLDMTSAANGMTIEDFASAGFKVPFINDGSGGFQASDLVDAGLLLSFSDSKLLKIVHIIVGNGRLYFTNMQCNTGQ